jgi:hypothetical protein
VWDRTTGRGQSGQSSRDRTAKIGHQHMIIESEQPEQEREDTSARKRQCGHNY